MNHIQNDLPTPNSTPPHEQSRALSIAKFSIARKKSIFWILAVVVIVFLAQFPKIMTDTDPENMLPASDPARMFHNQVKQTFAMHDSLVVGLVNEQSIYQPDTLAKLAAVTDFIDGLDEVVHEDILSLSTADNITQAGPGTIRFEWMMATPPDSLEQAQKIQASVNRLPTLKNTLVSNDGQAAIIYVPLTEKDFSYQVSEKIKEYINNNVNSNANDQWHITGLPVAEDQFGHEMFVQMAISAPLAGLVIFILLWVFFRNIAFITAPMIIAMATVIITMGALIACGFSVHIMSSMIAIFLMPIAVVDSVHVLSEFSDSFRPGKNPSEVISEVIGKLFQPMLYTSVTSAVGFYSLYLTPIPPVQVFGVFIGSGILVAFALTILFLPAYLCSLSNKTLQNLAETHTDSENSAVANSVRKFGQMAVSHRPFWLLTLIVLGGVSAYGISKIQINDNPVRWFKPSHEIRIADKVLNNHFAGTYDAYLIFEKSNASDQKITTILNSALTQTTADGELRAIIEKSLGEYSSLDANNIQNITNSLMIALDDYSFTSSDAESSAQAADLLSQLETLNSSGQLFLQPESLNYLKTLQEHLQTTGLVGKSNSLSDVVMTVNRELRSGNDEDFTIPNSANAVAQTLLQYQSSHRPQDLWHFVNKSYDQSLVWLQLTSGDNKDMSAVVAEVKNYIAKNPLPEGMSYQWAGKAYINLIWQEKMVSGMFASLASAFVTVFIIMAILFRSIIFGVIAMMPLTLSIALIYGVIGIIGKDYDMPIAVLSALTLGISVDFAIHFIERLKAIYAIKQDWQETLKAMFEEPGRAITRNAIVIAIGFTPLLFAPLVPYITVGVLLASIMTISAVVTLIMIPNLVAPIHKRVLS
ncbi:efflux RND transporter permease subunit [Sessilibacter sp. MAH4]